MMKIQKAEDRNEKLIEQLADVWERSVRATHHFLSEEDIKAIGKYVPIALQGVPVLIVAENDRNELIGFMGIDAGHLEMLFLDPKARGKGIGKALLSHGIEQYGVCSLAVNEQNPEAAGFYEHVGFKVCRRTETDEQGNPWPLLYMKLEH